MQEAVPIRSLLRLLLLSDDCHVQRVVLSLYNALFNISSRDHKLTMRRTMEELNIRNTILTKVRHHSENIFLLFLSKISDFILQFGLLI